MKLRVALLGNLMFLAFSPSAVKAEPTQFCVKCVDPNQTYVCQVEAPQSGAPSKGLQLYCIVRTSKEGGHRSCAVDNTPISRCAGPVKSYAFVPPGLSPNARAAIERYRGQAGGEASFPNASPSTGDEPATVFGMTRGAVGASKKSLQSSGQAVGGAASKTGQGVGKAARGVGKAAGKVGSATKKTGSAVGSAARTAYDCMRSFFRDCRSSDETQ